MNELINLGSSPGEVIKVLILQRKYKIDKIKGLK